LRSLPEVRLAAAVMGLVNLVAGLALLPWLLKTREFSTTRAHVDAWVLDAISELKGKLGIRKELRVWVIESRYPCAMLVWSELVLCRGLFELFNEERRVVEAVIAHELAHYKDLKFVVVKQAIAMTALFNLGVLVSTTLKLLEDSQLSPDLLVPWLVLLTSTALALLIPPSLSRVEELLADVQASLLLKDHRPLLAYFNRVGALHPQVIEVRAAWKILTLPLILITMLLVNLVIGYFNSHPPTSRVEWLVTTAVLAQQETLN
jgi:Zn-dependent protease with chaperone function